MSTHTILLILHVFGAGIMIGVGVFAFVVVARPPVTEKGLDRIGFVGRLGMWASIWQLLTGAGLMANEWGELSRNPLIWTKIALWVLEGALSSMLIGRQVVRIRAALAVNQPPPAVGLASTLLLNAVIIIAITAIGVFVVSGAGEPA